MTHQEHADAMQAWKATENMLRCCHFVLTLIVPVAILIYSITQENEKSSAS